MKTLFIFPLLAVILLSCKKETQENGNPPSTSTPSYNPPFWIQGTWRDSLFTANGQPQFSVYGFTSNDIKHVASGISGGWFSSVFGKAAEETPTPTYYYVRAQTNQTDLKLYFKKTGNSMKLYQSDPNQFPNTPYSVYVKD